MTNMFAARFRGRPLAMAPRAMEPLLSASFPTDLKPAATAVAPGARGYALAEAGIAVVPIIGSLLSRGDWLTELFGILSYAEIGDALASAFADPAVSGIVLEIDSPGGEVGGLFDLVAKMSAMRQATGKPLWAVASETALSGGYAIASAADRIYVTRTGEVGSIGVVAAHVDESGADAMAGEKWTLIQAGARKTDGNPHQPLSSQALSDIQADVDALYEDFVGLVAKSRALSREQVIGTEAAIYRGQRGIDAGLADGIGTLGQAISDLAAELRKTRSGSPRATHVVSSGIRSPSMTTTTEQPAETPEAQQPSEPGTPATTPAASETRSEAEVLRAEYADIAAIAAQAARLGVEIDAADAMRKGIKPDALRRSVLDALAARSEASAVVTAPPATPAAGASPIVRRARERAGAHKS